LRTSVPRPRKARPRLLLRTAVVIGVLLLLAAAIAPLIFPDSISKLVRGIQGPKQVGVLVGVPDSSPAANQPVPQVTRNTSISPPSVVSSQAVKPTAVPETPAPANATMTPNPFHVAPADVQQAQIASAQPQPATAANSAENSAAPASDNSVPNTDANSSARANTEPPPTTVSQSNSNSGEKSVASKSKRAHAGRSSGTYSQQGRTRSIRSRVTGITSDGRLILRLPSGRTAIVAPDEEGSVPRHRNRVYIDRDQMFGPPPGFGPEYFPDD